MQQMAEPEVEDALVGALLLKPTHILQLSIDPTEFTRTDNRVIVEELRTLVSDSSDSPEGKQTLIQLGEQLKQSGRMNEVGGTDVLAQKIQSAPGEPDGDTLDYWVSILEERSDARTLYQSLQEAQKRLENGDNPEEVSQFLDSESRDLRGSENETQHLTDKRDRFEEQIPDMMDPGLPEDHIRTGFDFFDYKMNAFGTTDLTYVAGEAGSGKSTLCTNFANFIAKNEPGRALYFSGEMRHNALLRKILAYETGVSLNAMKHGQVDETEARMLRSALDELEDSNFYLNELDGTVYDVQSEILAQDEQAEDGVSIAFIDYIQLLDSHLGAGAEKHEVLDDISKKLMVFTNEYRIPVVGIMSLNNDGGIYGNSQGEHDCTNLITIQVVPEENEKGIKEDQGKRAVGIAKARNAPEGSTYFRLDGAVARFDALDRDLDYRHHQETRDRTPDTVTTPDTNGASPI